MYAIASPIEYHSPNANNWLDRIFGTTAKPLIDNAAFLEVELEDLQKVIAENGTVDSYQNGANQYGRKIGSEVQSYNALLKSYNTVNNRLADLLPKKKQQSKLEALLEDE